MSLSKPVAAMQGVEGRALADAEREREERQAETRRLEVRIALVLRTGVLLASALLAVALPWIMFQSPSRRLHPLTVGAAIRQFPSVDPRMVAALGVLILVATPVLQLFTSAILFWRKRDRLYVAFALTVCGIIGLGAALSAGGH